MKKPSAVLVSLIFVALAIYEFNHSAILQTPWSGFTPAASYSALILIPLWLWGAASPWSRREWANYGGVVGAIASLLHGVVLLVGQNGAGVAYLLCGPILGYLFWRVKRSERPAMEVDDKRSHYEERVDRGRGVA